MLFSEVTQPHESRAKVMSQIIHLIEKDLRLEIRTPTTFLSIVLYLLTISYISYFAFQGSISTSTWNSIYWIITLFALVTGIGKSFLIESDRSLYYYYLIKPGDAVLAKLIFNLLYGLTLNALVLIFLNIFLPVQNLNFGLFTVNNIAGLVGLCSAFTLISSISANAKNQSLLMSVLGFPLALPIVVMAVANSKKIMSGAKIQDISGNLISLVSLDVIIIAMIFILFPYSWKK